MLKILILGVCGKMGTMLKDELLKTPTDYTVYGVDKLVAQDIENDTKNNPKIPTKWSSSLSMGNIAQVPIYANIWSVNEKVDVIVDFSTQNDKKDSINYALKMHAPLAIFSTACSAESLERMLKASKDIPVLYNQNASIGINAIFDILPMLTKKLKNADTTLYEVHHKTKLDSPSGTAKKLIKILEQNGQKNVQVFPLRAGTEFGYHEISFYLDSEVVTISHRASSRKIFVLGAIDMIKKLVKKSSGFFDSL